MAILQIILIIVFAISGVLELASKQFHERIIGLILLIFALVATFLGERI